MHFKLLRMMALYKMHDDDDDNRRLCEPESRLVSAGREREHCQSLFWHSGVGENSCSDLLSTTDPEPYILQSVSLRPKQQTSLRFLVSARVVSDPRVLMFFLLLWNDVQLQPRSIGIMPWCDLNNFFTWMFARFVRPLLATILCVWEIWSQRIHVSRIYLLAKQKLKIQITETNLKTSKKARNRTDFYQKPDTFFSTFHVGTQNNHNINT